MLKPSQVHSHDYFEREVTIECGKSLVLFAAKLKEKACQKVVSVKFTGLSRELELRVINPFYISEEKQQEIFNSLTKFLESI